MAAQSHEVAVPDIVQSDQFHLPVSESDSPASRRIMFFIGLAIIMAVAGVVFLWLTHEDPVNR
jgi:H+/Cl- antiporter ClcA